MFTIGGVPEHFNYPWYFGIQNGYFEAHGIQLDWVDYASGTGAMCEALQSKKLDFAIVLTEGIIKSIQAGSPCKIIQQYIDTPLVWGIHVYHDSAFETISDLKHPTAAISRFGSGSHLMSYLLAKAQGWSPDILKFQVVHNIEGAISSLRLRESDFFMWEFFTTKPYVDRNIFRRIADFRTPWPCFVIAVRDEILQNHPKEVKKILQISNTITKSFKKKANVAKILADHYGLKAVDVEKWLAITSWSQSPMLPSTIDLVNKELTDFIQS